jgi:hypothetical protein
VRAGTREEGGDGLAAGALARSEQPRQKGRRRIDYDLSHKMAYAVAHKF